MDWPVKNAEITEADLRNVFRYAPQETTAVRLLATDPVPMLWSLATPEDWRAWLSEEVPSIEAGQPGLVLILARRAGENANMFRQMADGKASFGNAKTDNDFKGSYNEKNRSYTWPKGEMLSGTARGGRAAAEMGDKRSVRGGNRDVRQVPFEKELFPAICHKLHVHGSISRVISRADVPVFSRAQVEMGGEDLDGASRTAIVYNCRSANTWKDDLALTVTYFTRSKVTYAILFGCTAAIERRVLNRIAKASGHAFHPLLLPGIFAELERERMVEVVESTIDEIEGAIFDLDTGVSFKENLMADLSGNDGSGGARSARRTIWLNTTFLRNRLKIWKLQLAKMVEHVDELASATDFGFSEDIFEITSEDEIIRTGHMIRDRLRALIEEFDEKIEDCTMRVDGMTMATQWSHGDTNTDIATAAGQDSRQMRSISVVTMVFLPGTFFATVFSMTFFDWNSGGAVVSSYIWIYFLVTAAFTVMTLFAWWYFLIYRRSVKSERRASSARSGLCGLV